MVGFTVVNFDMLGCLYSWDFYFFFIFLLFL